MDINKFLDLIEELTGRAVTPLEDGSRRTLGRVLSQDSRVLKCSEMNELMLLVNKDRMSTAFFEYFFGGSTVIGDIGIGVDKFRRAAMLRFGNFVFAYRTLSRLPTQGGLLEELGDYFRPSVEMIADYKARPLPMADITPIERNKTHLLGYLAPAQIIADHDVARVLLRVLEDRTSEEWSKIVENARGLVKEGARDFEQTVERLGRVTGKDVKALREELRRVWPRFDENKKEVDRVQSAGDDNQDVYLTWDYMDVYFATSMRKRSEFEELHRFVGDLMGRPELTELRLRYFDPTQSYDPAHLNKALVEGLMLHRARCTVYSVQDTDTLGKDSELAATLAQGKPVIAYVSGTEADQRCEDLKRQGYLAALDRLRYVSWSDEGFLRDLPEERLEQLRRVRAALENYERTKTWRSLGGDEGTCEGVSPEDFWVLCKVIAEKEGFLYRKRGDTLQRSHPLALQMNLSTGVANGVLIARDVATCARLLRGVLTNTLFEQDLEIAEDKKMWYLKEKSTGSIFRVVTKDPKLTNCFWNYYRENQHEEE